jgi:hypothetical protein
LPALRNETLTIEAATIDGQLFVARTRDGGKSWQDLRQGLPQESAYDVVYRHALDNSGPCLAFGKHDRQPLLERRPGRQLDGRKQQPAADLQRALRLKHPRARHGFA